MEKICSNNIWTQKAIAVCSLIHSLSCAENSIFNIATQEKAFIDEVTESIYERKKAERDGKAPTYQQRV